MAQLAIWRASHHAKGCASQQGRAILEIFATLTSSRRRARRSCDGFRAATCPAHTEPPQSLPGSPSIDVHSGMTEDQRRYAPATARNREPILDVLRRHLPAKGFVLEVASGTGEHITFFALSCGTGLVFQPTDPDPAARTSIDAWTAALGAKNVRPAIELDAASAIWPVAAADAVLAINMVHISPWAATEGLVRGAARILPAGGLLYLYGPYRRGGRHTAPSNEAFDADLRSRNPAWGVRDVEAVAELARAAGFDSPIIEQMPANNLSVVLRRLPKAGSRA